MTKILSTTLISITAVMTINSSLMGCSLEDSNESKSSNIHCFTQIKHGEKERVCKEIRGCANTPIILEPINPQHFITIPRG